MSPLKKGQKLTDNPKDTLIHFRANQETVEQLEFVAQNSGMSKSEVIRKGITNQYKELKK